MPERTLRTPSYRLHESWNLAVVRIGGRDIYLGKHGTPESRERYDRLIAEWLANGRRLPPSAGGVNDLTINELILAYWQFAEGYFRKNGEPTSEVCLIRCALRPLMRLYGGAVAREFGPLGLKACRDEFVKADMCRHTVNLHIGRIRHLFRWAVANEFVPVEVLERLKAVEGLKRGRSAAKESKPVKPVPDAFIEAVRPHVPEQVWAMIELQQLTGMRPGEVTIMRGCDLDTSGKVWEYTPDSHKTEHHGHEHPV